MKYSKKDEFMNELEMLEKAIGIAVAAHKAKRTATGRLTSSIRSG
jgi:hypothetical protein